MAVCYSSPSWLRQTSKYNLIKLMNNNEKEKTLWASRGKKKNTKQNTSCQKKRSYIFKILKKRVCEPRILYPAKITFKYKGHKLLSTRISGNIILMNSSWGIRYKINFRQLKCLKRHWYKDWWGALIYLKIKNKLKSKRGRVYNAMSVCFHTVDKVYPFF